MSNKKNRSGTSQDNKGLAALRSDYVSVEERSIADLLMYVQAYAKKVNFYGAQNQRSDTWAAFLDFTDAQILELAQFAADPDIFQNDSARLERYSKPHLALLLTFLKLLQYPKEQFAALTEKNVAYFYENILQLEKQDEIPDQVHVIFTLARDVKEHLVAEGTLLNAGKDDTGADLHYQVAEEVVLNRAKVIAVKTIHLTKNATNLKYVHQSNNQGDTGFEKMLCLALGNLASLPAYKTATGKMVAANAAYLRTDLYQRIKGKEKDELLPADAAYILESLCFRSLKDFMVCLNLLYREINRGYAGIAYPEDQEWEAAYAIMAGVHRERLTRLRRAELKTLHRESGFDAMMEYAFGEPEPGDMLYKMPGTIKTLDGLAVTTNEATRQYIENKLCMNVADFQTIMAQKETALTSAAGEEVYALLEAAWTIKRDYRYPEIGTEMIDGFYADTIFDAATDEAMERFAAFGNRSGATESEHIQLGFAVSSPLLNLAEGARQVEMVVACKEGTIDHEAIGDLLHQSGEIFTTSLSTAQGWQGVPDVTFEHGKFIIKPAVKTYDRKDCALVCNITKYALTPSYAGMYIGFTGGKVYEINSIDTISNQMKLTSTCLEQTTGRVQLIAKLAPKTFVAELAATLDIAREALRVKSDAETFDPHFKEKYLIDSGGKIFQIQEFIDATEVEVRYCGALRAENSGTLSDAARLLLNKVWETIDFQVDNSIDLGGLTIDGIYAAEQECTFTVTDAALKIAYPEGTNAQQLLTAWSAWLEQAGNDPGRYEIRGDGSATVLLNEGTQDLVATGEVIKCYEALADKGLRVTYGGRPSDPANLIINTSSTMDEAASFRISGGTLTITPGKAVQTANQIAAAWRLWLEDPTHDAQGFQIESKDQHCWEAVPVAETFLSPVDQCVKKCEVTNLYGVGIRVWYTGPGADQPQLMITENTIDQFEFAVEAGQKLTIRYPASSDTSATDLVEAWDEWRASVSNDPGNFRIEALGDGFWKIQARTEKALQAAEGQIIECTLQKDPVQAGDQIVDPGYDAGIIARFSLSEKYQNAIVELVESSNPDAAEFRFSFNDVTDAAHQNVKTKKLTITYPPFRGSDVEDQQRRVQNLLAKWNRVYNKHGFSLVRTGDDAKWSPVFPALLTINFLEALNYVGTIDPDGFTVKYRPDALKEGSQYTQLPRGKVIITENDGADFAFRLANDYPNNLKLLYIQYPQVKANRTVARLLEAWKNQSDSMAALLSEFKLVSAGTGKWEITAATEVALTNEVTATTEYTDLINYDFYQYQTPDVNGFTLKWAGPHGVSPQVVMEEHDQDTFAMELSFIDNALFDVSIGEVLTIRYPKRNDKRRLVDLLTAWQRYKISLGATGDRMIGFEIVDTSFTLKQRSPAALLITGDRVRESRTGGGNGLCFRYIGHRDDPSVILEPIRDFGAGVAGQKVLWDNGTIFTVTERLNRNEVTVAPTTGQIAVYDAVKLYEPDALCLEALGS